MVKTHKVHTAPAAETVVTPRSYTEEQLAQITALRAYGQTVTLPEADSYHVWEQRWLDMPDTLPRYMRAAKWRIEDAKKRLLSTLKWRRDFKPDLISPDEVKIESESGKIILNGFDKDGRPVLYMRPGRENTEHSPRQIRHLVWCLERTKDFMPPGQDTAAIIIDYKSTTLRTNPSLGVARKVLAILQDHYVETLGRGLIVNLPWMLAFFYKGLSPFMDPVTRDKIRFNPDLRELVPAEQLDADFGGEFEYEFEPHSYWQQIVSHCGIAPDGTRVSNAAKAEKQQSDNALEADAAVAGAIVEKDTANAHEVAGGESIFPSESSSETAVQMGFVASDMDKLAIADHQLHAENDQAVAAMAA